MKKSFLHIDIMRGESFVKTAHMPYNPLFRVSSDQVMDYIQKHYPSLYAGKFTFHIY